jgi:hypothetical protein
MSIHPRSLPSESCITFMSSLIGVHVRVTACSSLARNHRMAGLQRCLIWAVSGHRAIRSQVSPGCLTVAPTPGRSRMSHREFPQGDGVASRPSLPPGVLVCSPGGLPCEGCPTRRTDEPTIMLTNDRGRDHLYRRPSDDPRGLRSFSPEPRGRFKARLRGRKHFGIGPRNALEGYGVPPEAALGSREMHIA